jgi:hypothetical protein
MRKFALFAGLAALALTTACHRQEGRGGLSADDDQRLDNAATMLDSNVIDTSPDDLTVNASDLEGNREANALDVD